MKYKVKVVQMIPYKNIPICASCNKELRSLGNGFSNSIGTTWSYRCDTCNEDVSVYGSDGDIFYKEKEK